MCEWLKDQFELLVAIFDASLKVKTAYFATMTVPLALLIIAGYLDAEDPQQPLDQISRAVHHLAAWTLDWRSLAAFVLFLGLFVEVFLRERRRLLFGE